MVTGNTSSGSIPIVLSGLQSMNEQGSDIFISYSSKDHAWVSGLAQALEACGYSVWWDRHLLAGENFHKEIERALNAARCVVTVWSEHSVESKWVVAESGQGDKRGVLIPLVYRPATIPLAFQTYHNSDLQQWRGGVDEDCFQTLLRSIERVLQRPVTDISQVQGEKFLQADLRPSPARDSSIHVGGNLTIGDGSVVHSGSGDVTINQFPPQLVELLQKQNFSTQAINSFFHILEVEHVPPQDYEQKLQDIAQSFRELKERLNGIQTSDKDIVDLKQQADEAIDSGQFEQARKILDQAEEKAMDSHVENRLITAAEIAATKGALARTQLQYEAMGEAYENAANKMAALGEKHHVKWSEYLNGAGTGFENAGQYKRSEPLYEKALALREQHSSENQTDIATSLNNLANLYIRQGRYEDAEPLYLRSLAISEKALGKDHPSVAATLNNLAELYRNQGRYEDAEPLYLRSLAISEKALGKDHPSVATTLNNLAGLYGSQGRYEEAEPLYQRDLAISEKALGKDHPSVATTLNNLAGLYESQGRYEDAEPLYLRSLAMREKALGKDHPDVAQSLNNLALLYESQGRYEDAEPLYLRSLAIFETALGKDHPSVATTLNNLGLLFFNQGKLDQAADYLEQALTILKKTFGDEHPNVKMVKENLDYVQQQSKK